MNTPSSCAVSVVVPTFNRQETLIRVLEGLASQDGGEDFEVIVVSDGSTDGTDELLNSQRWTPLRLKPVLQANAGPAAARNRGVEHARGDLVIFLDDDVVPSRSLIGAHRRAHEGAHSDVVVIGPMLSPADHRFTPWVAWEQAMLMKQYEAMAHGEYVATMRQFYTGNASLRRLHLLATGGFDSEFRRSEDVDLAIRLSNAGLAFVFDPSAIGYHYAKRSFESWRLNAYSYGRNDVRFARDRSREWIYGWMAKSFRRQHVAIQRLVRLTTPRPRLWRTATTSFNGLIRWAPRGRPRHIVSATLSALYALEYHRGVADELGGPAAHADLFSHAGRSIETSSGSRP